MTVPRPVVHVVLVVAILLGILAGFALFGALGVA